VCERESWEEGKEWARGGEGVLGCHCIEEKWSVRMKELVVRLKDEF
jgi:hypothetical protein